METDVGQAEFLPSGFVSLHLVSEQIFGPPYTHLQVPEQAQFWGAITVKSNPAGFLEAARGLLRYYEEEIKPRGIPLLVNTQGWVKGLGYEILRSLVAMVNPTFVVETLALQANKNLAANWSSLSLDGIALFDIGAFGDNAATEDMDLEEEDPMEEGSENENEVEEALDQKIALSKFLQIPAAPQPFQSVSPPLFPPFLRPLLTFLFFFPSTSRVPSGSPELRAMSLFQYFAGIVPGLGRPDTSLRITHQDVFKIPWDSVGIFIDGERIDPLQCLYLLNVSLVGLLVDPDRSFESSPGTVAVDGAIYDCPRLLSAAPNCPCVGLGLIRSIDVEKRLFYLVTPLPLELLRPVNGLFRGTLEVPFGFFQRGRLENGSYMGVISATGLGSKVRKPRTNLQRRSGGKRKMH